MMALGFTGTQIGMSYRQKIKLDLLLRKYLPSTFHHGDCIGADEEAHKIVSETSPGCKIIIHPPDNSSKRAFCTGYKIYTELPYITRNHNIVDYCAVLIAAPRSDREELRSGTWATVRYARKEGKHVLILPR